VRGRGSRLGREEFKFFIIIVLGSLVQRRCYNSNPSAKVGVKKKSHEFRDSFGTDGTISVLSVLIRYKIGTNTACCYSAF
jgi:hypothetical protein